MANRVGQQFGNYRLIRLLGYGGFAEVYLGEHIYLKSQAAIKVLHTRMAKDDLESFLVEGRTLVRLIHPHIVRVLEFGVERDIPFLVMDYAPNGSIRQHHAKGVPLPLPIVIDYVRQIADALQYAHKEKVIHRDVKPANMLIGRQNEVLLSDFGTAAVAQSSRYENAQEMAGTVAYMAPEQFQTHPRPASDQYSLGVVVYEWLSGERPFQGSFTEVIAKHAFAPPPPLRERVPSISPAVEQVVFTALEKDPSRRFATVSAFALALEQASHTTSLYWSNFPTASPGESLLSTVISPPVQSPPQANVFTPPPQLVQPLETITPPVQSQQKLILSAESPVTDISSLAPTRIPAPPPQSQQNRRKSPRRPILLGLLILLLISAGILGLTFFPILSTIFSSSATSSTSITPTASATHTIVYTNIAGSYSGQVHNTRVDKYAPMSLTINQNQGSIDGQITIVGPNLLGTGTFTGTIDAKNNIQFLDVSHDTPEPILFQGMVLPDGSLSGSYCSVNQNNQCGGGGFGTWSVTKQ